MDLTENEVKKIRIIENKREVRSEDEAQGIVSLIQTGFFDGGDKASVEELIKALNKSFSQADPQQASCILSYIL